MIKLNSGCSKNGSNLVSDKVAKSVECKNTNKSHEQILQPQLIDGIQLQTEQYLNLT